MSRTGVKRNTGLDQLIGVPPANAAVAAPVPVAAEPVAAPAAEEEASESYDESADEQENNDDAPRIKAKGPVKSASKKSKSVAGKSLPGAHVYRIADGGLHKVLEHVQRNLKKYRAGGSNLFAYDAMQASLTEYITSFETKFHLLDAQ